MEVLMMIVAGLMLSAVPIMIIGTAIAVKAPKAPKDDK